MDKKELCKELKKIRMCKESGYTISSMASALGVNDQVVRNLENGKSNFKMRLVCDYCKKLCSELGVHFYYIYYPLRNDSEVVEFIENYKEETGYDTFEVAEMIGCSKYVLNNILSGKASMKIDMLLHFLEVIDTKIELSTDLIVE